MNMDKELFRELEEEIKPEMRKILDEMGIVGSCRIVYYQFAREAMRALIFEEDADREKLLKAIIAKHSYNYVDRETHLLTLEKIANLIIQKLQEKKLLL